MGDSTLALAVGLGEAGERETLARALAARIGVDDVLLLASDPQLGILLPAPGFPRTLRGDGAWRAFVARCASEGAPEADVELPPGQRTRARARVVQGLAFVMLGGKPDGAELAVVEPVLPLLARAIRAEMETEFARAEVAEARRAAGRAQALASALEAARAETAKLNAELRDEHRRKDDFLAMLAHELRNPLTPLVTAVELLRRKRDEPAAVDRNLDIMSRQLRQLTRLVEDLLDVSRVSRGRIELRRQPLLLGEVLADSVESARPVLDARAHSVTLAMPPEPLHLDADHVRLTQVFANLLHNAAKYTDPGGRIEVRSRAEGGDAVVEVSDNGIGLSPEMIPLVFELFTQAPVSLARAQGGLGVGLTLVRALVELHGGSVAVKSEGLGHGSTFTVRLPLAGQHAWPAPAPEAPPASAPESPRALRVLVVDDNEDAADSLAMIWRLMGHHAEVAYTGIKALQVAGDLDPDVVLLDIGLPEMDGYEVAVRMRRVVPRRTRFVALTGYGTEEDKRRSREAGFDEHLVKPVDVAQLEALAAGTCAAEPASAARP